MAVVNCLTSLYHRDSISQPRPTGVPRDEFNRRLRDCLDKKGVKADAGITRCAQELVKAFSRQPVKMFSVGYGSAYRAVSIYVELMDGRGILARSEADSTEGIVGFSIFKEGEKVYSGADVLSTFGKNINKVFAVSNYESISTPIVAEERI